MARPPLISTPSAGLTCDDSLKEPFATLPQPSDFTVDHRNDKNLLCGTSFAQFNSNRPLFLKGLTKLEL